MSQTVTISALAYADHGGQRVNMTVSGWFTFDIPFTYDPDDIAPLTLIVKDMLARGAFSIAPYPGP